MNVAKIIDPWGSVLVEDYNKLIKEFGLETFNSSGFPSPNRIMRRGIVFASRDISPILTAIKKKKPYYALSGIMPSAERIHLGNKMVIENISYFQEHGAKAYVVIADLEAAAARGISIEEAKKMALEFHVPAYVALGLDQKKTIFYFQSENKGVISLAYEFSKKVTANEFKAIYGSIDPGRIMSALTQVGDILFPQLDKPMPCIVPVGIDQDPHIRLTRDITKRFTSRYHFIPPSGIYHKYTPSLDGSLKMSKSKPESCIEIPEDVHSVSRKIKGAFSGGRGSISEHRKKGAIISQDMPFEFLKQHFLDNDKELQRIYDDYISGKLLSSEVKEITIEKMTSFMKDFEKKLSKAKKQVSKLNFIKFS